MHNALQTNCENDFVHPTLLGVHGVYWHAVSTCLIVGLLLQSIVPSAVLRIIRLTYGLVMARNLFFSPNCPVLPNAFLDFNATWCMYKRIVLLVFFGLPSRSLDRT